MAATKKSQLKAVGETPKGAKPTVNWREFEIEETYEYDFFERMPGNRPLDEQHVIRLMKLIKAKDLKVPIQINQNAEIVDGQHRLEARRRIGFPVYFFVTSGYGLEEVQTINASSKRWTIDDFVRSFMELGKSDYQVYDWFRKQYPIPHNQTVILLSGAHDSRPTRNVFTSGEFKVKDLKGAREKAEKLLQLKPFFEQHWNNSRFVQAMLFVMNKKAFEFDRFLSKLKAYPTMLKPQADSQLYIKHIEDIYNYRSNQKVSLEFGEDK